MKECKGERVKGCEVCCGEYDECKGYEGSSKLDFWQAPLFIAKGSYKFDYCM